MFPLQRPLTGSVVDLVLWLLRSLGITNRVAFLLDESGGFALMHIFVRSRVDCFILTFFFLSRFFLFWLFRPPCRSPPPPGEKLSRCGRDNGFSSPYTPRSTVFLWGRWAWLHLVRCEVFFFSFSLLPTLR